MRSACRSAFTLLEVLAAATLSVVVLTLVMAAFMGIRRLANRNALLVGMHEAAANIHDQVATKAQATVHTAKIECTAVPGPSGWGGNAGEVTLTWMATISDPRQLSYGFERELKGDMLWCRLKWTGGGLDAQGNPLRSTLRFATNAGYREALGTTSPRIYTNPQFRRDRRRDLDDNDLRFIPGLRTAKYLSVNMPGDAEELDGRLEDLHAARLSVRDFELSWVDRGGWTTIASNVSGIRQLDRAGSPHPLVGGPAWENEQQLGIDGVFLDARAASAAGSARTIADTRPMLLRLRFTVVEAPWAEGALAVPIELSFPTGSELAIP